MSRHHMTSRRRAYGQRLHDLTSRPAPRPALDPDPARSQAASRDEGRGPIEASAHGVSLDAGGALSPQGIAGDLAGWTESELRFASGDR